MANNLKSNPIVIDTVAADVVISDTAIRIRRVDFWSNAAAGKIVLKDTRGNAVVIVGITAATGGRDGVYWEKPQHSPDLFLDSASSTFPAGSTLLIYV